MNRRRQARGRWKLLAKAVKGYNKDYLTDDGSCYLHQWGLSGPLFQTRDLHLGQDNSILDSSTSQPFRWIECKPNTNFSNKDFGELVATDPYSWGLDSLQLRIYTSLTDDQPTKRSDLVKKRLITLSGFDNTGNVHIWSSELLLAHAILCPPLYPGLYRVLTERFLQGSYDRICELGAGMTGATGLAVCMLLKPSVRLFHPNYVLLTDGNWRCVESLTVNAAHHLDRVRRSFKTNLLLEARKLAWKIEGEDEVPELEDPSLLHSFDLILAADCFFNPTGHRGLLQLIDALLCDSRHAALLAIAPWRGTTLKSFLQLVSSLPQQWSVTCLGPETYMHPKWFAQLLQTLRDTSTETVTDQLIGQIILMQRVTDRTTAGTS